MYQQLVLALTTKTLSHLWPLPKPRYTRGMQGAIFLAKKLKILMCSRLPILDIAGGTRFGALGLFFIYNLTKLY